VIWAKSRPVSWRDPKQERAAAEQAAGALPASLERIGAAEGRAERTYRVSVEGQRAADATGIPRLSAAADPAARAESWRIARADHVIAGELRAFQAAVAQRYGDDRVRKMLRLGAHGERSTTPAAERQVAAVIVAASAGERADATEVAKQREAERLTQRRGVRM